KRCVKRAPPRKFRAGGSSTPARRSSILPSSSQAEGPLAGVVEVSKTKLRRMGNRGRRNHRGKEEDDHGGVIASRICSHEPDQVPYSAIEADPVTRSWREHLRRDPVPHGQRVLFNRRWLSEREGELPSGVQAAGWLDIKRVYMEL